MSTEQRHEEKFGFRDDTMTDIKSNETRSAVYRVVSRMHMY